jgi:hypothetical protein
MRITAAVICTCWLLTASDAAAQTKPASLATLFQDVYGPNGLVVNSDEQQLDGSTHAAHFNSAFQSDFRLVNIALASQLTSLPVPSPASGFIYTFDSATGTFVRSSRSFGPILADRGETIGRGRIAFATNYQYFSFDHLDGISLTTVPAVFRHDAYQSTPGRSDVISTANTINVTVGQLTSAFTYGLTDRIDLSVAVPMIQTQLSLLSNATIERVGTGPNLSVHYFKDESAFGGFGSTRQFFSEGSATGIGDVLLRAKGMLMKEGQRALAAGIDVRLPTGDEENLLGAGAPGVRPFGAFSASYKSLAPHFNVAYQWNGSSLLAGDVATRRKADLPDQFVYAAGTDISVNARLSLVLDLLGQRIINSPRLSTYTFLATGPFGSVNLQDLAFTTDSYWITAGSVGMKANLAPRLLINFNLRFPIGSNGLTDRLTPLIGAEWAF